MGHPSYQGQSRLRVSLPLLQLLLLLRLRCCSCRIADEGDLFVRSRYDDPCGLCGCNFANAAMGAEKVVVDDHQPHKRGTFCPESAGGLDAILEFAVKPLVLVVMTEAVLQVNLPAWISLKPLRLQNALRAAGQNACRPSVTSTHGAVPARFLAAANRGAGL